MLPGKFLNDRNGGCDMLHGERKDLFFLDGEMTLKMVPVEFHDIPGLPCRLMGPEPQEGPFTLLKPDGEEQPVVMVPGNGDQGRVSFRHAVPGYPFRFSIGTQSRVS